MIAGDACFDHGWGSLSDCHSLLGTQRRLKRKLDSNLSAIYWFLPECERGCGGIIHSCGYLHVVGYDVCLGSQKALIRGWSQPFILNVLLVVSFLFQLCCVIVKGKKLCIIDLSVQENLQRKIYQYLSYKVPYSNYNITGLWHYGPYFSYAFSHLTMKLVFYL